MCQMTLSPSVQPLSRGTKIERFVWGHFIMEAKWGLNAMWMTCFAPFIPPSLPPSITRLFSSLRLPGAANLISPVIQHLGSLQLAEQCQFGGVVVLPGRPLWWLNYLRGVGGAVQWVQHNKDIMGCYGTKLRACVCFSVILNTQTSWQWYSSIPCHFKIKTTKDSFITNKNSSYCCSLVCGLLNGAPLLLQSGPLKQPPLPLSIRHHFIVSVMMQHHVIYSAVINNKFITSQLGWQRFRETNCVITNLTNWWANIEQSGLDFWYNLHQASNEATGWLSGWLLMKRCLILYCHMGGTQHVGIAALNVVVEGHYCLRRWLSNKTKPLSNVTN